MCNLSSKSQSSNHCAAVSCHTWLLAVFSLNTNFKMVSCGVFYSRFLPGFVLLCTWRDLTVVVGGWG